MCVLAARVNAMVNHFLALVLLMFRRAHSEALLVGLLAQRAKNNKIHFSQ